MGKPDEKHYLPPYVEPFVQSNRLKRAETTSLTSGLMAIPK